MDTVANPYALTHLSDRTLLHDLASLVARDRATTAALLAHLAEIDARRLYLPAGYPSMYDYCKRELHLSEECAYKRICAARVARRFPAIFAAVAQGRLHLTAVVLLGPRLSPENASALLDKAAYKTKFEIQQLLAEWFPRLEMPAGVHPLAPPDSQRNLDAAGIKSLDLDPVGARSLDLDPVGARSLDLDPVGARSLDLDPVGAKSLDLDPVGASVQEPTNAGRPDQGLSSRRGDSGPVEVSRPRVTPLSPQRFELQLTIGQATYDRLRHAQALLGHQIPSGDIAQVFDRALDALITQLEKRKFSATARPRPAGMRAAAGKRYVPASVKRSVWERDGGRCTFVSEAGKRCPARTPLEYDHVDPVARGGRSTVAGLRLRCRAHNQYEAERAFGPEFMRRKREAARQVAAAVRAPRVGADTRERTVEAHASAWRVRRCTRRRERLSVAGALENLQVLKIHLAARGTLGGDQVGT